MNRNKMILIVISIILIPIILACLPTAISFFSTNEVTEGIASLILFGLLLKLYIFCFKKFKRVDNITDNNVMPTEDKEQIKLERKIQKEKMRFEKEKQNELMAIEANKWKNISNNFCISEEYKKIRVNNQDISFEQLISAELLENSQTMSITTGTNKTKGKNKKHIAPGKALVGGALLGPVGAIIGGTSGKTTVNSKTRVNTMTSDIEYCKDLTVKIVLKDINNPLIMYKLVTYGINKNSSKYLKVYNDAQRCVATIQAIVNNK